MARRECRTAGVESGPKSSIVKVVEHGKAASPARPRDRAGLTARRVRGGAALGGPKKPKPGRNAPDTPTSVWSEMARKYLEPLFVETANDDRRLSVGASQSCGKGAQRRGGWVPVRPSGVPSPRVSPIAAGLMKT